MCVRTPWEPGSPEQSLFPVPDFVPTFEVRTLCCSLSSTVVLCEVLMHLYRVVQAVCANAVDKAVAAAKAAEDDEAAGGKPAKGKKKK